MAKPRTEEVDRGQIVHVNHEAEFRFYPEDNRELWENSNLKGNMTRFVF